MNEILGGHMKIRLNVLNVLVGFSALALAALSATSWCQSVAVPPAEPASQSSQLEEVVVTAQRREEASSKVPITIAAYTGDMLQERSVSDEIDLESLVPGLTVKTGASTNQLDYAIRGQSLDAFSGSPPGVLPYMNDVAMPTHTESSVGFYDMGSIQVLKGPQGTLFGRNDTGGAVLFNTVQPNDQWGGYVDARFANYSLREYQGAVNIPVVPGILDVRLAGDSLQNTGYVQNLVNGIHLGDNDNQSGRVSIKYTPSATLSDIAVFQYNEARGTENNPLVYSVYSPGQKNSLGQVLNDNAYLFTGGAIVPYLALQQSRGYYDGEINAIPTHTANDSLFQNTTVFDVSADIQIKNIVGFSRSDSNSRNYFSGAPFQVLTVVNPVTGNGNQSFQWLKSDELQLLGHTDELKYIFGGYWSTSSDHQVNPLQFGPVPFFAYDYKTTDNSRAAFGQGTYDLSRLTTVNGLSFTAGIRYTWDVLGNQEEPQGIFFGAPSQSFQESAPSWQLGLQYQVTNEELLYIVNRGSWRAGGFTNADPAGNLNKFNAEQSHDVELGSKFSGQLFGRSTNLNIAVYEQITHNAQHDNYVNLNGIVTGVTANVPEANVKGAELNFEIVAVDWLRVGTNVAYTDAVFSEPVATVLGQPLVFTQYADTPRWTGAIFASARLPVPTSTGGMSVRADVYSQSTENFSSIDLPGTTLPAYTTVNLRYDWQNILQTKASVALYAKNLLNREYFAGGFALGATIGENLAIAGAPRTFGVDLNYKF